MGIVPPENAVSVLKDVDERGVVHALRGGELVGDRLGAFGGDHVEIIALRADIPVRMLAHGREVHDVVAVARLDDAGVAGLARGVKAPCVKLRDHLAGIDLFIQSAVGGAASVGGVFRRHEGEGILGMLAGLPLGKQVLRLLLGLGPCRVGVIALFILLGRGDQDMADVHHFGVVLVDVAGSIAVGVRIVVGADVVLGIGLRVDERLQIRRSRQQASLARCPQPTLL